MKTTVKSRLHDLLIKTGMDPYQLAKASNVEYTTIQRILSGDTAKPSKSTIAYQLPNSINETDIIIYDIKGQEIKRFRVDTQFNNIELDNSDLQSGTYFYTLLGTNQVHKMIIVK